MFKSKFSKLYVLLLVFGILFSTCSVSYAKGYLPDTGEPNSIGRIYNDDGSVKQERKYDENGLAEKDIDYNHGGVGHEFPHVHDWEWTDGKSDRKKPRKPKDGELKTEKNKNVTKKVAVGAALGTALYFIISEGSRIVFPPRNLIPIL